MYSGWVVGFFFLVFFMESTQNSCGLDFTTRHVALRSSKKRLSASWLWWASAFNKRDERLFLPQNIYSYSWMKTYIWMGKEVHSLSCKVCTHRDPKFIFLQTLVWNDLVFPLPPSILSICLEAVVVLPEERIDDGDGNGEGIKTGLLLLMKNNMKKEIMGGKHTFICTLHFSTRLLFSLE